MTDVARITPIKLPKPKRCKGCRKRNFMNMKCRCKKTVCLTHCQPSAHSCTFDWQTASKEALMKALQDAIPPKINQV